MINLLIDNFQYLFIAIWINILALYITQIGVKKGFLEELNPANKKHILSNLNYIKSIIIISILYIFSLYINILIFLIIIIILLIDLFNNITQVIRYKMDVIKND